jgi:Na+/melibiose symporter-like transporter
MNWNELEHEWRLRSAAFAPPAWNLAEFEQQRRRRARQFALRDWLEAGTGFAVAALFAVFLGLLGVRHWAGWGAVGIVVLVSVVFLRERRRAAHAQVSAEAPLRTRLAAEIIELRHQRTLLRRVVWWYLVPLLAAGGLFVFALHEWVEASGGRLALTPLLWLAAGGAGLGIAVWWLNRLAVTTWIEPQLADCERALAELDGAA